MKNIKLKQLSTLLAVALLMCVTLSCERDPASDAPDAKFPNIAGVFDDAPINLTDEFFISFDPAAGANTEGFNTDDNEAYEGNSSIRIDVPAPFDPNGNFIGGIFKDRGEGRDLTSYDALTFWLKGSITASVTVFGFGTDFEQDRYVADIQNVPLTTNWRKVIIPIPDASKLVQEKGMFKFSAGSYDVLGNDNVGFTFWIDEIKFEKLGTLGQERPEIFEGNTENVIAFSNTEVPITGTSVTVNLPDGSNQRVITTANYFDFEISNENVARVAMSGNAITILDAGTTEVRASLAGELADGVLNITSNGFFPSAPTPTEPAANVISVYSGAYDNVVMPNFTPGFGGSTTVAVPETVNGDEYINYSNNNFTGILWVENPIDASGMAFLHVDVFAPSAATSVEFQIRDVGPNGEIETNVFTGLPTGDDVDFRFTASGLNPGEWNEVEIPLAGNLINQRDNIGAIILVGGPDFYLDNIYFYTN